MKQTISTDELAKLINNVQKAVDASNFGPVYVYGGTAEEPKKIVAPVAFQIFGTVLKSILDNYDKIELEFKEPSAIES